MATRLVTIEAFKEDVREPTGNVRHEETLGFALDAATDAVQDYCDRLFVRDDTTDSPTANARVYRPTDPHRLYVRDFYDTTGLAVKTDTTDNGTYDTTWTITTDYLVAPFNQRDGYPWYLIEAVGSKTFPCSSRRPTVEVTALYGWDTVPDLVRQITLEVAADLWKRRDAPFGVVGFDDFSSVRVRSSYMPVLKRLDHLKRYPILVA